MRRKDQGQNTPPAGAGVALPDGEQKAPYIHPAVPQSALSAAQAYQEGLQGRLKQKLPKVNTPVAGGEAPPIPRLDSDPERGNMTMSQHALAARERVSRAQTAQAPGGFVEAPPAPAGKVDIRPLDILPDQAKDDPNFMSGSGSMFASSQPALAMKYGVVRDGKIIPPQVLLNPVGAQPELRPETLKDIERLRELEAAQTSVAKPPESGTAEMGRAAGTVGNMPGDDSSEPLSDTEREQVSKAFNDLDEYEFDTLRQAMMKDLLNSEEQKKLIEARVKPMDVGDLITMSYVIQDVPVAPGRFDLSFKTMDGETDLAIKRLIMEESRSLEVSDRYYLDKFALMSMTALLHSINGKAFKDHRNDKGDFDDDKFREKFRYVMRLPTHMLASIGVHAMWFEQRVRELFAMEKLGNG